MVLALHFMVEYDPCCLLLMDGLYLLMATSTRLIVLLLPPRGQSLGTFDAACMLFPRSRHSTLGRVQSVRCARLNEIFFEDMRFSSPISPPHHPLQHMTFVSLSKQDVLVILSFWVRVLPRMRIGYS